VTRHLCFSEMIPMCLRSILRSGFRQLAW
jgi:hypothetical protein